MTLKTTSLHERRALITGAQQGIGKAAVLALASAGADVAINWLDDKSAAQEIAAKVTALKQTAQLIQGSVATKHGVQKIVDDAHAKLSGIDILVNNAGVFPRSEFLELDE